MASPRPDSPRPRSADGGAAAAPHPKAPPPPHPCHPATDGGLPPHPNPHPHPRRQTTRISCWQGGSRRVESPGSRKSCKKAGDSAKKPAATRLKSKSRRLFSRVASRCFANWRDSANPGVSPRLAGACRPQRATSRPSCEAPAFCRSHRSYLTNDRRTGCQSRRLLRSHRRGGRAAERNPLRHGI